MELEFWNSLFYLQNIQVKVDLLKTIEWSVQSHALAALSHVNVA